MKLPVVCEQESANGEAMPGTRERADCGPSPKEKPGSVEQDGRVFKPLDATTDAESHNEKDCYVPLLKFPDKFNPNLICFDSSREKLVQPWTAKPFTL